MRNSSGFQYLEYKFKFSEVNSFCKFIKGGKIYSQTLILCQREAKSTLLSRYPSADDCQGVFVNQNICVLITVILVKGWAETGHEEECGETGEHLEGTWASCLLVRRLGHWHDWNLRRDTWHVTPGCLPAGRHVSPCALCDWNIMVCQ